MRERRDRPHWLALFAAVAFFLSSCGDDDDAPEAAPDATTAESRSTSGGFPEEIAEACAAYEALIMDSLDASDDEMADRLDVLASGTAAGGPLEVPLAEMAEAFRRGDTSIPETVTPICLGEAPTTAGGEESDDRERYLSGVRAAAPDIADSDSDLITAIELGCDTLGLAEDNGRPPSNRDQLLASAWAPLDEMDHAEHVLRVGVPIFCPDHAELVTRLLG